MFKQLPQVDFTFGVGDIVGSIALLVSIFVWYISHTRASQSEQIKMSRDLWTGIKEKYDKIEEEVPEAADPEKFWPALKDIDYFAYLIVTGEIKDKVVLRYYRDELTSVIEFLLSRYGDTYRRLRYADKYINLDKLIAKWEISIT